MTGTAHIVSPQRTWFGKQRAWCGVVFRPTDTRGRAKGSRLCGKCARRYQSATGKKVRR